jgi:hypothetical protein
LLLLLYDLFPHFRGRRFYLDATIIHYLDITVLNPALRLWVRFGYGFCLEVEGPASKLVDDGLHLEVAFLEDEDVLLVLVELHALVALLQVALNPRTQVLQQLAGG